VAQLISALGTLRATHRFFKARLRPIVLALLTTSGRLTRPICLRFIFDGLGSFTTHSGTGDPDCSSTFAMLRGVIRECVTTKSQYTHDLRNGASSFVKYVTAFPSLPARPVRPGGKLSLNAERIDYHIPIRWI